MTNLTEAYPVLANPGTQNRRRHQLPAMNQAWDNPNTVFMTGNHVHGYIRVNNTLYEVEYKGKAYNFYTVVEFFNDEASSTRFDSIEAIEAWASEQTANETENVEIETMTISETKTALRNTSYTVRDISGTNSFGYQFAIVRKFYNETLMCWDYSEPLATSESMFDAEKTNRIGGKGAFYNVFDANAVNELINA